MAKAKVVTPPCVYCHKRGEVEVDLDEFVKWENSDLNIQDAMPSVTDDVREQLITGTHPECWIKLFGEG